MKVKILLGIVSSLAVGTGIYLSETATSEGYGGYTPRSEIVNVIGGQVPAGKYFEEIRMNPAKGKFDPADMSNAIDAVKSKSTRRAATGLKWVELGPNNVGGRTRSVLVDKDNSNRIYAGSVSGGLFISNNGGGTWEPYNDLMENLVISSMDQSSNGDIYVGTGSIFDANGATAIPGGGVFKSTDGGKTFSRLASTVPSGPHDPSLKWSYVNRIKVDPKNPQHVYAGTNRGLMFSSDGGNSWVEKFGLTCGIPIGNVDDVEFNSKGRLVFVMGGKLVYSDNPSGDFCSNYKEAKAANGWTPARRSDVAICKSNPDKVYAVQVNGSGQLKGFYESDNGAETWNKLAPDFPSAASGDTLASLFGRNGQGYFDLAIEVFPNDCEKLLVGGVQFYRGDPNWTKVANGFTTGKFYVHSDIQYFTFDPKNSNTLYIASDGGIGKSSNATADEMHFIDANRGYNVTQYYSVAFAADGKVVGGTQDNGSHLLDPTNQNTFNDAFRILGGDGFDCEISDIGKFAIPTLYYNDIYRVKAGGAPDRISGSYTGEGRAPFHSVIRLWESMNDPTSQDSIVFNNDTVKTVIATGNGTSKIFTGKLKLLQPAAKLVNKTVSFRDVSLNQIIADLNHDGTLTNATGDSVGNINYTTLEFKFKLAVAPADKAQIRGRYAQEFKSGDVLDLQSLTQRIPFKYTLTSDLGVGDSVKVQDKIQGMLASTTNDQILLTRDVLRDDKIVRWTKLNHSKIGGIPAPARCMAFSKDGNHLYVGTGRGINNNGGAVFRYSGLNKLYNVPDDSVHKYITRTTLYSNGGRNVSGITVHPTDPEKLIFTLSNYMPAAGDHVYEITNAQSATSVGNANRRNITGDLVNMPVHDAEYNMNDTKQVLIATDFGVWSTTDVNSSNVKWASENAKLANVQVLALRQQRKKWNEASNSGAIYLGTYGRGIWVTGDLTSVDDNAPSFEAKSNTMFGDMEFFPNPVSDQARIKFNMTEDRPVDIRIFDLNGRAVKSFNSRSFGTGTVEFQFDASDLSGGTYFVTLSSEGDYNMTKFVVVK